MDIIIEDNSKNERNGLYNYQGPNLTANVPHKYRQSRKKLSILDQEYATNHQLLELKERRGLEISSNLDGLNGKQIY